MRGLKLLNHLGYIKDGQNHQILYDNTKFKLMFTSVDMLGVNRKVTDLTNVTLVPLGKTGESKDINSLVRLDNHNMIIDLNSLIMNLDWVSYSIFFEFKA